ncbi:MAG: hypothetical protein WC737_05170 [Parcubacteria group bacterium]
MTRGIMFFVFIQEGGKMRRRPHQSNGFEILMIYYPKLEDNSGFLDALKKYHSGWQLPITRDRGLLELPTVARKPKIRKKMELALVAMGTSLCRKLDCTPDFFGFGNLFCDYYGVNLDYFIQLDFFHSSKKRSACEVFISRVLSNLLLIFLLLRGSSPAAFFYF